ncbi:hypothetical protein AB0P00_17675 [Microbacterium sp. NPDC077057]|uniref:hypothetical protein n=1 Tax=Microbacterium sp. NPDC077057 TaxID=3154763 RepID=UPI00342F2E38
MNETLATLMWSIAFFVIGAGVLYAVVRAAVVSALRHHALWRADGSYEIDLERHRRDMSS